MLKKLGNKGQTYDEVIQDLINWKDQDSLDREVGSPQSSESGTASKSSISTSQDIIKPIEGNKNLCDGNGCNRGAITEIILDAGELGVINLNLCENCRPKFKKYIIEENSRLLHKS
jgi:hypothetical protein